jgi:hypothetical protein
MARNLMANPSKRKGSTFERQVADYLRDNGFPYAERRVTEGANDRGDIAGVPGVVIEAKNCKRLDLGTWVVEMLREQKTAGAEIGAIVHKRRNHGVEAAYVTMTLRQFVDLIR